MKTNLKDWWKKRNEEIKKIGKLNFSLVLIFYLLAIALAFAWILAYKSAHGC